MSIIEGQRRARPAPQPLNLFLEFDFDDEPASPVPPATPEATVATEPIPGVDEAPPADVGDAVLSAPGEVDEETPPPKSGARRGKPRRQRDRGGRRNRGKPNPKSDTGQPDTERLPAPSPQTQDHPGPTGSATADSSANTPSE